MSMWLFLVIEGGLLLAVLFVFFWHPQRSQSGTNTFGYRKPRDVVYRDDDRYWYGGFIYNNPDDPALFIPKRYGIGWTMNFGHPQSKWFLIAIFILAVVLPTTVAILGVLFPGSLHPTGCHPSGCY